MKRATLVLAVLALLLGGVGQARAGLVTYSSQSSFDAATTGLGTIVLWLGGWVLLDVVIVLAWARLRRLEKDCHE